MSYQIYGDARPKLHIVHDGWEVFGMTLCPVDPESREWLAKHLDQAFAKAIDDAKRRAVLEHQHRLQKLLGVML